MGASRGNARGMHSELKLVLLVIAVEQDGFLSKQHSFNFVTQEVFDVARSHFAFVKFKSVLTGAFQEAQH